VSKDEMQQLKDKLEQALHQAPKFEAMKEQVQITVTGEGLRVELLETKAGMFFETGNANPTETGAQLLSVLAQTMGKLANGIVIEGHTDAKPYSDGGLYTNWELSADRANATRRYMEDHGLRENQVHEIRGFADQLLRTPDDPENASNRRISVIVKYLNVATTIPAPAKTGGVPAEKPTH